MSLGGVPMAALAAASGANSFAGGPESTLGIRIAAIFIVLAASLAGVLPPILYAESADALAHGGGTLVLKAAAAGVVASLACVHVFPDAVADLAAVCDFPLAGALALAGLLGAFLLEQAAGDYFRRMADHEHESDDDGSKEESGVVTAGHGHGHGALLLLPAGREIAGRAAVVAHVLELGIVVHSLIVGINLGVADMPGRQGELIGLVVALTFHQLAEGLGLGAAIAAARPTRARALAMAGFFAVTTPAGIVAGIAMSLYWPQGSPAAVTIRGVFNALSAGVLLYLGLVTLLAEDFGRADLGRRERRGLKGKMTLALLGGAGAMTLLAVWS